MRAIWLVLIIYCAQKNRGIGKTYTKAIPTLAKDTSAIVHTTLKVILALA
jgi:hypothetical protein